MSVSLFSYASSNTFLSRLTLSTGTGGITVTLQVAVFVISVPSSDVCLAVTVMIASPSFFAVILTFPMPSLSTLMSFLSTLTLSGALLSHCTFTLVAFLGLILIVSSFVSSLFTVVGVGSISIFSRAISVSVTVTAQVAVFVVSVPASDVCLAVTVMVALPASFAVILAFPSPISSTVAISGLSLSQFTLTLVALLGVMMEVSSRVFPFFSAAEVRSSSILSKAK